jgi:imidazole glycerol phosphate synthase glutamine amidotransferase subunit
LIGIIDYGAGNLFSVKKALDYLDFKSKLINSQHDFLDVQKIILPGVGHFSAAVHCLKEKRLFSPLKDWLRQDNPFLGICLGMQLLFERSEESVERDEGFGLLAGSVLRLRGPRRLHMGWNCVSLTKKTSLFEDLLTSSYYYFIHGYIAQPVDENVVIALSDFGGFFPAVIGRGNILGVQFHPEKSGRLGLELLSRWGNSC